MTPKLYKAAEVCDLAQVQPYVLRSWEKEFPGIGIQKSEESPRLYRQSDLDQVLRIKQLVFGEGLTLAGARRKLEESMPTQATTAEQVSEVIEVVGADVQKRIARVRDGLRSLLHMLDGTRGYSEAYELTPPPAKTPRKVVTARGKVSTTSRKAVVGRSNKSTKRVSRAR